MIALHVAELHYTLHEGRRKRRILDIPELRVDGGRSLAVTGPSGGGKTSLLHILAGILPPGQGQVFWNLHDVYTLPEARRDVLRAALTGMVFQDFQLIPGLSALDNVLLPLTFRHWRIPADAEREARDLLLRLAVRCPEIRIERLSRGEMQRVALARAFMGSCGLLFADEPTASLDAANARQVADMLRALCRERNATLICVTHDPYLMSCLDRRVRLEDGRLREMP